MYSIFVLLYFSRYHSTFSFLPGLLMTCFMMLYNGCSPFLFKLFKLFLHFVALNYIFIFSRSASFSLTQVFNSIHKATSRPFNIFTYILHRYSGLCFKFKGSKTWHENRHMTILGLHFHLEERAVVGFFTLPLLGGWRQKGSSRRR